MDRIERLKKALELYFLSPAIMKHYDGVETRHQKEIDGIKYIIDNAKMPFEEEKVAFHRDRIKNLSDEIQKSREEQKHIEKMIFYTIRDTYNEDVASARQM